ncbi:MAG: hypothetical protein AAFP03_02900 [Cyanobacteria bacterium J06598_3]
MANVKPAAAPAVAATATANESAFQPESGLWVALRDSPSAYSHDEALLLCEAFPGEWVSWVPGYGEITLSRGKFHHIEEQ